VLTAPPSTANAHPRPTLLCTRGTVLGTDRAVPVDYAVVMCGLVARAFSSVRTAASTCSVLIARLTA
jgi:hypothetical protein